MQVALAGGLTFVSISPSILISLTRVSNVPHGLVRTVVEEAQSFLTAELLTLKQLSAGVQVRVAAMTEEDAGRQDVELPRLEYHTEDKDDDLLMDDYDVGLLGRDGDWKAGSRAQEMEKASKPQDSVKLEGVHQDAPAPDAAETELKLELPGAARDWFNQLPKSIRRDWKELASAFRKKIDKTRTSYSERYYTWK
ncbi:hypothetical protein Pcac1_g25840 [Phytophthora cactorum]|nr:hypothetical protein Pcac1_g25840 [Phytophthora cactorum]